MIDAMRSLINTSVEQFRSPQIQPDPAETARAKPQQPKTYAPNPAVEVTLSPQAQAILRALEANDITVEQLQAAGQKQQEATGQEDPGSDQISADDGAIALPDASRNDSQTLSLEEQLNAIAEKFGLPEFDPDTAENLALLFREVQISLQPAEGAEAGVPVSGTDGMLAPLDRMKVAALYAELDRLLGSSGVFFGGDQNIQRLTAENQIRARELKASLNGALGAASGTDFPVGMTAPQEARIDAILREISQLYARANDPNADPRRQAVDAALGSAGAVAGTGGASLEA
ncbi:hypothetical protein [Aestuariispira insulae]|uniref:Uncharacterized protein n=1 Tax=Aestuariispira insulae TaxID=1461337 RepID=A0A3D9HPP3_9PROT|nr:hypothetical protein [Aestuariispira insulae]RED51484.1 hypothetical protein DFP90_103286 [Aestuariispira insulae]